jgi:hypothetical protein
MYYLTGITSVILLAAIGLYQQRSPFLDREIKGSVTLSSEWIEIIPEQPLKPEREQQEIVLHLEEPFVGDFEAKGVRLPNGSIIQPEVQLVDVAGNIHILKYYGFRGRKLIRFTLKGQLNGREYRSVRVRSEQPIRCKGIIWSCFYWKDTI